MLLVAVICIAILMYTWVGYPAVMAGLARLRRAPTGEPVEDPPTVSVILATREPDAVIVERVVDITRGAYPTERLEVIVALDAGRPSQSVIQPIPVPVPVKVVRGDAPGGKAAALNAGVRAATGDVLVFTDAAQRFDALAIGRLVEALLASKRMGAVSGALHIETPPGRFSAAGMYWKFERALRRNEARLHSAVGVTGAIYAMRRALWVPLPAGLILDDVYAPMQLVLRGFRVGFREDAIARDARHFPPEDEFRRKARTLTGVLQLCAWLPTLLNPARNPIWVQFASHKLFRLATPYLLVAAAIAGGTVLAQSLPPDVVLMSLGIPFAGLLLPLMASRRAREAVAGVVMVQAAVVKATMNAVRGDWDVWRG